MFNDLFKEVFLKSFVKFYVSGYDSWIKLSWVSWVFSINRGEFWERVRVRDFIIGRGLEYR